MFFGGGDEVDEARAIGSSRLGWAHKERLGDGEEGEGFGGDLG